MNSKKLSDRLSVVASYIPKGSIVADIGSDHAYLPCYLIHNRIANRAIAGEVVKGPYESARKEVKEQGLEEVIEVRLENGLKAIREEDLVDVITIAGMGGPLIVSILDSGKKYLNNIKRLVLQPNIHAKAIREWAVQNGWNIIDEDILKEDGKIYEVLVLEKGTMNYTDIELLVGPFLMRKNSRIFIEKWTNELLQWERIISSLEQSKSDEKAEERKAELKSMIHDVKGVLGNEER